MICSWFSLSFIATVWSKIKTNKESERWKPDTEVGSDVFVHNPSPN